MRQAPLPSPLPLHVLQQSGLLGLLDAQDKLRGLFSYFGDGSEEEKEGPPSVAKPREVEVGADDPAHPCPNCAPPDESPGYVQRQLSMALRQVLTNPLGVRQMTQNPLTGEIYLVPYAKSVGERYSDTASKLPIPGGVMPPGPSATGPITTLPRSGLLFGPGPGAISQPQAEDAGTVVFSRSSGRMSKKDCDKQKAEEMQRCHTDWGDIFGYNTWPFHGCKQRTQDRHILCRKGRTDGPLPWSDADVDGIVWPKPPTS